jgi:alkyl hydroperoxide reductase subunit AhpF
MDDPWDCIVVGAGATGLSAALVLGRARRRTLVVDAGRQSNRASAAIGGLLGADGVAPDAFYAAGRAELAKYPAVELRHGEVVAGRREDGAAPFALTLAGGREERARRVVLATGTDYNYPDVPGIAERWGRSVFHCPFCHGWEHRGEPLGVLDRGASGVHRALLLRTWSEDITLFSDGDPLLGDGERTQLERAGVAIDDRRVAAVRDGVIAFADGTQRPCGGLLVPVTLTQRSPLATQLGATTSADVTPLHADAIIAPDDASEGLVAAGDAAGIMPSVANAIAAGANAAANVVQSLALARAEPA